MTETKPTYTVDRAPWIVQDVPDHREIESACHLFRFAPDVAETYLVDDDGHLYVFGDATEDAFMALWAHLMGLAESIQRAIGNALVHARDTFGEDWTEALIETTGRRRNTLQHYLSTYSRLPTEHQAHGVKHSYDRQIARLPQDQQPAMIDRVLAGEFVNSDQCAAAVREQLREPERETFAPVGPVRCPICNELAVKAGPLEWSECVNCGAHVREMVDRANLVIDAVREFMRTGDRGALDALVTEYHIVEGRN